MIGDNKYSYNIMKYYQIVHYFDFSGKFNLMDQFDHR